VAFICKLISVYYVVLFGRIILSWFPLQPGTALASIASAGSCRASA